MTTATTAVVPIDGTRQRTIPAAQQATIYGIGVPSAGVLHIGSVPGGDIVGIRKTLRRQYGRKVAIQILDTVLHYRHAGDRGVHEQDVESSIREAIQRFSLLPRFLNEAKIVSLDELESIAKGMKAPVRELLPETTSRPPKGKKWVYLLYDRASRTGYIGTSSDNLRHTLAKLMAQARKLNSSDLHHWLNQLAQNADRPYIRAIKHVPAAQAKQYERKFILEYRAKGMELLNTRKRNHSAEVPLAPVVVPTKPAIELVAGYKPDLRYDNFLTPTGFYAIKAHSRAGLKVMTWQRTGSVGKSSLATDSFYLLDDLFEATDNDTPATLRDGYGLWCSHGYAEGGYVRDPNWSCGEHTGLNLPFIKDRDYGYTPVKKHKKQTKCRQVALAA